MFYFQRVTTYPQQFLNVPCISPVLLCNTVPNCYSHYTTTLLMICARSAPRNGDTWKTSEQLFCVQTLIELFCQPMKIASFNVNSLRARLRILLDWMEKESPDILCLQETKVSDEDFPRKEFLKTGFNVVFRGEKTFNGVAILSKMPFEGAVYGFEDGSEASRLITAGANGLTVVNTYVPQGFHPLSERFREKLDWLQRLYYYFSENF